MKRILIVAAGLLLGAGCSATPTLVYKPGPPEAGVARVPVRLAVLPFADGTEDFTRRGKVLEPETLRFNLAKSGIDGQINALTPAFFAKSFAEELAASGRFRSVRFLYDASELVDEDYRIEGTVDKATVSGAWNQPNDFVLRFRAMRAADSLPVWEKTVSRSYVNTPDLYAGCGASDRRCQADRGQAHMNEVMRGIFSEAGAALAAALRPGANSPFPPGSPGDPPSGPVVGVGLEVRTLNGELFVVRAIEGNPAAKAGIRSGDSIVSVDGWSTRGEEVAVAAARIRGVKGTPVTLGILREGWRTERAFTLIRDVLREGTPAPAPAEKSVDETIEGILKGN